MLALPLVEYSSTPAGWPPVFDSYHRPHKDKNPLRHLAYTDTTLPTNEFARYYADTSASTVGGPVTKYDSPYFHCSVQRNCRRTPGFYRCPRSCARRARRQGSRNAPGFMPRPTSVSRKTASAHERESMWHSSDDPGHAETARSRAARSRATEGVLAMEGALHADAAMNQTRVQREREQRSASLAVRSCLYE